MSIEQLSSERIRVLALIFPIERHVGHWACSSDSIEVRRIIMEGADLRDAIRKEVDAWKPQAIAIIGKRVADYHDLLDEVARQVPALNDIPRIYRCQNTVISSRVGDSPTREELAELDHWFAFACDPRFDIVFVQTLTDVELIARALPEKTVAACPFGYDPSLFDPDAPELERSIDVGCYFTLRDDDRRSRLVERAARICEQRGWSFQFASGRYWQDYVQLLRTTKVALHLSDQGEVPFRAFEATCCGSVFVTDPLAHRIEEFLTLGREYLVYQPDLLDLESILAPILEDEDRRHRLSEAGRDRARLFSWPNVADQYVAPTLRHYLGLT